MTYTHTKTCEKTPGLMLKPISRWVGDEVVTFPVTDKVVWFCKHVAYWRTGHLKEITLDEALARIYR